MFFDGEVGGGKRINLGGQGGRRGGGTNRDDFVRHQLKEREAREKKRIRDKSATLIQKIYRSYHCLKVAKAARRATFDKNLNDIRKIAASGLLQPEQEAQFVLRGLWSQKPSASLLRLFVFFFDPRQDANRLVSIRDLVIKSASQPSTSTANIVQLALRDDNAERLSFLVVFRKLMAAALRLGPPSEAARLFLSVKSPLFDADFQSRHQERSRAAIALWIRRTDILESMTRDVLPQAVDETAVSQAIDLILLSCAGIEVCTITERQEALVYLLSTPRLGSMLTCEGGSAAKQRCLTTLVSLLVQHSPEDALPHAALDKVVEVAPRGAWMIDNLAIIFERFLVPNESSLGSVVSGWLKWLCWVKDKSSASSQSGLERLYTTNFVRSMVLAVGREDSDALLTFCHMYFSGTSDGGNYEPPAEVLQTLAFATPLAERLFPTLAWLLEGKAIDNVFKILGPPHFVTAEAVRLRIFCSVYALQMQPMYDYEFFGPANPLKLSDIQALTTVLNRLAYKMVVGLPAKANLSPTALALRTGISSLVRLLYNRHCRKPLLIAENAWIIPESRLLIRHAPVVDLGNDEEETAGEAAQRGADDDMDDEEEDQEMEDVAEQPAPGPATAFHGAMKAAQTQPGAEQILESLLEEIPHVLPFKDRVELLHNVIQDDQDSRRTTRGPHAQASMEPWQIGRNTLVEDGFAAFNSLAQSGGLRDVFRVQFIAPNGETESGVDGGGLFKEFMVSLNRAMFDPEYGLFTETSDRTLYPSISAFKTHKHAAELYTFVGQVVGKAIYEMFLLEPQFSRVFLNRLLGRTNEVDDVAALDVELHQNMIRTKEAANVEDMDLTFSVSVPELGLNQEVDLIPGGRDTPVTKDNLTRYFHLLANWKTNVQFKQQTAAFLRGLQCVIPLAWLKMFDPYELNLLISGSNRGFDVSDLRQNTKLSGGYEDDSPVVQWLWQLLEEDFDAEDMARFLMFSTSCSRPPLLGFKTLYPAFCIHRVPDGVRLPTASTCANLLKLPDYPTKEVLKQKLIQAIRAEAGFDLS